MSSQRYFLALNRINQVGPRTVQKLLNRWPNLEAMFQLSEAQLTEAGLPINMAKAIATFNFSALEEDWSWQQKENHHLITWDDASYPALLKEIHDPPPVLYAIGDLGCLQQTTLAMVGSRKPSVTGSETAHRFAFELASQHLTIVSGLALGIDAQAHQGCLDARGNTVAVMGTGINQIYPRRHLHLAEKISQNGLLLSEFPLNSSPVAGHFPRRNRIISGLSLATLVVEAAIRSGSLITARQALEQNRDVFAIPGSIHNPQAKGCHYLVQQGAKLITSTTDVLEELGLKTNKKMTVSEGCNKRKSQNELPFALASANENLVKCIGFEITSMDKIIARSGLGVEKVACGLAELELQGAVKAVPGGYMRCSE